MTKPPHTRTSGAKVSGQRQPHPSREPATIDLKATVVDEPAGRPDQAAAEPASPASAEPAAGATTPTGGPEQPILTEPRVVEEPAAETAKPATGSEPPVIEEPAVKPAPAAARERRVGAGALAAAGLLGGLAGAGAFFLAESWRSPNGELSTRLAQLEARLGTAPSRDAVQAFERRLAALEGAQAGDGERLRALQAAAEASAARADAASRDAGQAGEQAAQALQRAEAALSRSETAANQPTPAADAASASALADLTGRIAALETQDRGRAQAAETAVQALEQRLAERMQQLEARIAQVQQALEQRIGVQDQQRDQQIAALTRQLGAQDQQVATLARQLSERGSGPAAAAARLVVTNRLQQALRDGTPYADSLAILRRLDTDPSRFSALEPFAQAGAPTGEALAQAFRPIGERLVEEQRPEPQGWRDRLLSMADRVVTVRPVNETGAAGVPGLVARIEAALERGAFADALSAWQSLPEPARQASAEWGQRLQQRVAASEAARRLSADALAALDASIR